MRLATRACMVALLPLSLAACGGDRKEPLVPDNPDPMFADSGTGTPPDTTPSAAPTTTTSPPPQPK